MLSKVEELYDVTKAGDLVRSLHSSSATPVAFLQAVVLYAHIYNQKTLGLVRDVLLHLEEEGSGIRLVLASYDHDQKPVVYDHGRRALIDPAKVKAAVGPHIAGTVEVLGDVEEYLQSRYSLRNVLPPECVDKEEVFPLWPSWVENELAYSGPLMYHTACTFR